MAAEGRSTEALRVVSDALPLVFSSHFLPFAPLPNGPRVREFPQSGSSLSPPVKERMSNGDQGGPGSARQGTVPSGRAIVQCRHNAIE